MSDETIVDVPCTYQGYEFGAGKYPDSLCIDGSLHDADDCDDEGGIYLKEEDIPCPVCRPLDAIDWWAERNESFCDEGESDEEAAAIARSAAVSLVTDIRRNRGLTTDIAALSTIRSTV